MVSWSAANGGLRDGGLSKSEDIWGNRPFSSIFWISLVLFAPSGKGRKRQKKGEKADFGRFPGRVARHPLSPDLLHPHLRQPKFRDRWYWGVSTQGPWAEKMNANRILIFFSKFLISRMFTFAYYCHQNKYQAQHLFLGINSVSLSPPDCLKKIRPELIR